MGFRRAGHVIAAVVALTAGCATALSAREGVQGAGDGQTAGHGRSVSASVVATAGRADAPAPHRGQVTNLPLPRFVSLKTDEGNARRGPGLTHRIDWVFVRPGMPLQVTAEHEHWRRVEDSEGAGGWVHYSLLSGSRTVLVAQDLVDLRARPDERSPIVARAELGVVARVIACDGSWCRITQDRLRGWVPQGVLWGVLPGERFD